MKPIARFFGFESQPVPPPSAAVAPAAPPEPAPVAAPPPAPLPPSAPPPAPPQFMPGQAPGQRARATSTAQTMLGAAAGAANRTQRSLIGY